MKRAAALALLAVLAGCQSAPVAPPASPHQVRYRLEWSLDGVERSADGSAWESVNDLGYRVRVTRGYVVSYSMELVECPRQAALSPIERLGIGVRSLLEGTAYAGHNVGTPNPAAVRTMHVESLVDPVAHDAGAVTLAPQAYCQLHYLVARAAREATGLPSDLDMVDSSLHIDGTYRAADSKEDVPFSVHSAAAYGALFDRDAKAASAVHVDTGERAAQVVVRRHLASLFYGVDFVHMRSAVMAGQILKSFIDHVEVEIGGSHENG